MYPEREEFLRLANDANTVAVYREIAADLDTPVSAFLKLHYDDDGEPRGEGFLLESVEGGDRWGRYSLLGSDPLMTLAVRGGTLEVRRRDGSSTTIAAEDPLEAIAGVVEPFKQAQVDGMGGFAGGFVGYLAYDVVRHVERLPVDTEDDLAVADVRGLIADNFVVFDNVSHTMKVVSLAHLGDRADSQTVEAAYEDACARVSETIERLERSSVHPPRMQGAGKAFETPRSNLTPEEYGAGVEAAKRYIRAGDIIQVVLSQRFSQPLASHPFSIYRALRTINPSPYMFYLDFRDEVVVGASPEVMVKVEDRDVCVRPIAGTIRRGRDADEDARLVAKMLADPKEKAEHIMLLDLGRNDIGRVADIGTVEVAEQMTVEKYSHVNHIVSHVRGRLREDKDCFDAFRATFPAGTLSGAPKVRAMEIIEELERTRRGVYGGAVGHIDFSGNLDTCIAIRTVLIKNGTVYLQVGAGIVADSDPVAEQRECEHKARGILKALERALEIESS